jgi:threonine dehydratase
MYRKIRYFFKVTDNNLYLKNEALLAAGTFNIRGAPYKINKVIKKQRIKNKEFDGSGNNNIHISASSNKGETNNLGIIAASAENHA